MREVSKRVRFRALLEGGMSKTAISRALVIGRRTATRWAAAERAGRCGAALTYGPRPAAPSVLDPYKKIVLAQHDRFDCRRRRLRDPPIRIGVWAIPGTNR